MSVSVGQSQDNIQSEFDNNVAMISKFIKYTRVEGGTYVAADSTADWNLVTSIKTGSLEKKTSAISLIISLCQTN